MASVVASNTAKDIDDVDLWPLNEDSRKKIVDKICSNLTSLSFFADKCVEIDETVAYAHAIKIESEAFDEADQESKGEAKKGSRVVMAYARKASDLMISTIKSKELLKSAVKKPIEKVEDLDFFDISGGKREFLEKEEAEVLLAPLLQPGATYSKVCFSGKSFGKGSAPVAAAALANVASTLTEANLSDIIAGRPEAEALAVLSEVCDALKECQLSALDLSNNAFGEKGIRACGAVLQSQRSLKRLYFCNNGISAEAAQAVVELLSSPKDLETLHFFNNMSGDEGARAMATLLRKASKLQDFRFSSTRVGLDGCIALANSLSAGSSLVRLDMRDNMFGEEGAEVLAIVFAQHPNLKDVLLGDTGLGDEGVATVMESLAKNNPHLEVLDLGGNDLTEEGSEAVARALASLHDLKKLVLCDNELGDGGVAIVSKAVAQHCRSLQELDLSTNEIGSLGAEAAAKAVANIKGFKFFNLNGNQISRAGINSVLDHLSQGVAGKDVLGPLDENEDEEGQEDED